MSALRKPSKRLTLQLSKSIVYLLANRNTSSNESVNMRSKSQWFLTPLPLSFNLGTTLFSLKIKSPIVLQISQASFYTTYLSNTSVLTNPNTIMTLSSCFFNF